MELCKYTTNLDPLKKILREIQETIHNLNIENIFQEIKYKYYKNILYKNILKWIDICQFRKLAMQIKDYLQCIKIFCKMVTVSSTA